MSDLCLDQMVWHNLLPVYESLVRCELCMYPAMRTVQHCACSMGTVLPVSS